MFEEWLTFKSCFNELGYTVYYLDNEGNEIPIENECDFQEALRLAQLNKKSLKLIVCSDYLGANDILVKNQCESSDTVPLGVTLETIKHRTMQENSIPKEKCQCQCNGGVPPDWFLHYMKKFKKELLHELESSLGYSVPIAAEKKEIIDSSCGKIEATSAAITTQIKKKKGSEKGLDLLDQRESKMAKKSEKLYPAKLVRLEKLDNKTKVLMEEKRRLLEKKRHLKQRLEKNNGTMELEKSKRSATFGENKMCLFLPPSAEFVVTLNFTNDGTLRWEAPRLECYNFNGLYPKEHTICLPRLRPMERGFTTLRGKVSNCGGVYYFKCRLFDNQRKISPEFTCWAKVETTDSVKEIPNAIISCKESHKGKIEESEGVLIDFEKDEFTATQKKIEENINEIQRRLQDIDLLRPSTSSNDIMGSNTLNLRMSETPQNNGCDSLQNIKEKEINWKEKLEQEGVHFGVDCLCLTTQGNIHEKHGDKNGRVENIKSGQKNVDLGTNSDSELSLISLSEDDENFVMVPMVSESVNEEMKHVKIVEKSIANASEAKADSLEQKPLESFRAEILENSKEVLSMNDRRQRLPGPLKNSWPSLNEVSKSRAKKIKPNSSEYHFTTANLTQPTFIQIPERFSEEIPSKFTFTGVKNEEESLRKRPEEETVTHNSAKSRAKERIYPESVFLKRADILAENKKENISVAKDQLQENAFKDNTISATDGSKSIIYAVNSNGHCFSVEERSKDWRIPRDKTKERIYPEGVFLKKGSGDILFENQEEKISTPKYNLISTESRTKERIYPEGVFLKRADILTENKKENISVAKDQLQKNAFKDNTISATNGSKSIIYAVSTNGHCFPVEERSEDWRIPRDRAKERIYPEGVFLKKGSEDISVENKKESISVAKVQLQKENAGKDYTIPATEGSRNVIYAVNSNGHCFLVEEQSGDWDHPRDSSNGNFRRTETEQLYRSERRDDRFNEVPGPNIIMDTINAASRAFKTAKSVFNNIHSAFVTDGKTEMEKPASENRQEISSYDMCILVEMGFMDIELNRYLLLTYQNDLMKVIEYLLEDSYLVGYSK